MKNIIFTLIMGATAMGAAQAQTPVKAEGPTPYMGVGVSRLDYGNSGGNDYVGKLFGGVDFNQNWGLEAGYSHSGESKHFNVTHKDSALYVAAKATLPINEQWSVFGKVGAVRHKSSMHASGWSYGGSDIGVYSSVGAQFKLSKRVSLTAEIERNGNSNIGGPKPNVFTGAVKYSF
jgi:hypothetical protein